ncbi:MAG TPA: (d)CMP kinase [Gemmataceae bacterium]|jgi:cytidylate kinase|nr:(d)CMP kinase [Gemmataceae bacterium]
MIVTIDGPAGAGKSSVARLLAKRLDFDFLDTGAMYRAVALAALRRELDLASDDLLGRLVDELHLEMRGDVVVLDGEDVSMLLRSPEVTAATGQVADRREVRARLNAQQRKIAAGRNIVCEGRDQGTIVFPEAECKFFLHAEPRERARRRYEELLMRDPALTFEEVLLQQEERDARDAARDIAPMEPAPDAIHFDSTPLTLHEVVDRMEEYVRRRMGNAP